MSRTLPLVQACSHVLRLSTIPRSDIVYLVAALGSKPPLTALPPAAQVAPLDAQRSALSAWKARRRLAMIASGSARQMKGLNLVVLGYETIDRGLEVGDGARDVVLQASAGSLAKKPSTAFSHELDIGVKWKVQRGWRTTQARTFLCLWAA